MSKELEALECLEEIGFAPLNECCGYPYTRISDEYYEDFNTIKQALLNAEKEHKALEIIKEHIKFDDSGVETYTDDLKNLVTKFLIRLESKDTGATFHIHLDTEEELNILKEVLE